MSCHSPPMGNDKSTSNHQTWSETLSQNLDDLVVSSVKLSHHVLRNDSIQWLTSTRTSMGRHAAHEPASKGDSQAPDHNHNTMAAGGSAAGSAASPSGRFCSGTSQR